MHWHAPIMMIMPIWYHYARWHLNYLQLLGRPHQLPSKEEFLVILPKLLVTALWGCHLMWALLGGGILAWAAAWPLRPSWGPSCMAAPLMRALLDANYSSIMRSFGSIIKKAHLRWELLLVTHCFGCGAFENMTYMFSAFFHSSQAQRYHTIYPPSWGWKQQTKGKNGATSPPSSNVSPCWLHHAPSICTKWHFLPIY
jgi:hypothetical protein